ncbi:MAG: SusC/RagA family TonB-linked outer membrane protein [Chitinophagaceae bacterium]|nr:SusC/RagA family TonB-linked outer membrane protein [Chitinophagaceae bacterium]
MKRLFLFSLFAIMMSTVAWAQRDVTGVVLDARDNSPLSGVSVFVKGTRTGTTTDRDGRFRITAQENAVLVFSFTGFTDKEVAADAANLSVTLSLSQTALEEVVVTGYTTQNKKQYTGSVTKITGSEVNLQPIASFEQLLQGKSPGLLVQSQSGQPGSAASVTIRGKGSVLGGTQPLYIVDGIQVTAADFQSINPGDIESYNILKDAVTTSQYGSRGANGVIVVTTKRGRNAKTVFNYDYQYGVQQLPKSKLRLMNSKEKLDYELYYDRPDGLNPFGHSAADVDSFSNINADWEDAIFRHAKTQQHILSASGGNEKTRFFISGSIFNQDGLVRTTKLSRYTGRVNLDHTAGNFKIGISTTVGYSTLTGTSENDNVISTPLNAYRWTLPYITPYLEDGSFNLTDPGGNPNPLPDLFLNTNKNYQLKGIGSINLEYRIPTVKGLAVRTQWGIDFTDDQSENYIDINTQANTVVPGLSGAFIQASSRRSRYTGTTSVNYEKRSGDHNFGIGLFHEIVRRRTVTNGYSGFGLIGPIKNAAGVTPGTPTNNFIPRVNGGNTEDAILSYFAIANYDFQNKYFVNLTGRRDGSSRLAEGKKFVNYGGVGIGWAISSEEFMRNQKFFNNLKLKASYGSAGNASIGDSYEALEQFGPTSYNGIGGLALANLKKDQLSWETRTTANVGLEFTVLNNRLNGSVEAYRAITKGLYLNRLLSSTNGVGSILTNLGKLQNQGIEVALDYDLVKTRDLTVNVNGNWTGNKSKILQLDGNNEIVSGISINRVGQLANSVYVVRYAGVDPDTGEALYFKADGKTITNEYDPNDAVIVGSFDPKGFGGFGFTVNYRNFEVSTLFTYQYGFQIYNQARVDVENPQYYTSNLNVSILREWQHPGDITDIPSSFNDFHDGTTRFLEKGDFLRFRNIMVSYTFPKSLINRWKMGNLRLFAQGQNLYTWHNFQGYDPEVFTGVLTGAVYPALKTITIGASIGL